MRDLTEDCIASIGPLADERGLSLHLVCSHDAPRQIIADPGRLRQVLLNLPGNAVKFTNAGWVELRILASDAAGRLRLEVADTGPGIKETATGRLFRDFERLDAPSAIEGSGLGLAIAARFVGLMGGTVGHSPNPCGGSIFWLELPGNETVPAPPAGMALAGPPPGRRILLIDDIAMNRDVIGAFLRSSGNEVWLAENGQDGIRLASEQNFDVILMDVLMPEMDGMEATRRVRAQIANCEAAGMDGFVAKPVEHARLIQAIADAIAHRTPDRGANRGGFAETTPEAEPQSRVDRALLDRLII